MLFTGQTGTETDLPTLAAVVLGGATAGSIHAARAAVRPVSTATTGGVGNPLLSLGEDAGSLLLVVLAFVLPLIAVILVVALVGAGASAALRVRRSRRQRRRPDEPTPGRDRGS